MDDKAVSEETILIDAQAVALARLKCEHSRMVAEAAAYYTRAETAERRCAELVALVENAVPTNWCDPLLTGPCGIGSPPYDCQAIEKLLRGIKSRITTLTGDDRHAG